MPWSNEYKRFVRSGEWKRLSAAHLKANPLCVFCKERGITKQAEQVDHVIPCTDNPVLQRDPTNLRSLCAPCHAPLRHAYARGYSNAIGPDGTPTDHSMRVRKTTDLAKENYGVSRGAWLR